MDAQLSQYEKFGKVNLCDLCARIQLKYKTLKAQ
jgi:hypothetical protein